MSKKQEVERRNKMAEEGKLMEAMGPEYRRLMKMTKPQVIAEFYGKMAQMQPKEMFGGVLKRALEEYLGEELLQERMGMSRAELIFHYEQKLSLLDAKLSTAEGQAATSYIGSFSAEELLTALMGKIMPDIFSSDFSMLFVDQLLPYNGTRWHLHNAKESIDICANVPVVGSEAGK